MEEQDTRGTFDRYMESWSSRLDDVASAGYKSLAVALLLGAFFLQPAVRYIDIYWIYAGVVLFGMSLLLCVISRRSSRDSFGYLAGLLGFACSFVVIASALDTAVERVAINDARCTKVEAALLAGKSRRNDLADLFSALGCTARSAEAVKL